MPGILLWLGRMIVTNIGFWIVSGMISLGIGFAAHAVAPGVIDSTLLFSKFQEAGVLWNWVTYLNIDTDITIILSAWAGRAITDSLKLHLTEIPKKAT